MYCNRGGRRKKKAFRGVVYDEDEETGDILKPYYDSKLPAEEEGLGSEHSQPPALSDAKKQVAAVRADELIKLAASQLTTHDRTQHLMLVNPDILWLNAGGNPETVFREKLKAFGEVEKLKIFPRHCFACVSFVDARNAAQAQLALNNHIVYCNAMTVSFLRHFLSRDVILACQHAGTAAGMPAVGPVHAAPPAAQPTGQHQGGAEHTDEVDDYMSFLLGA